MAAAVENDNAAYGSVQADLRPAGGEASAPYERFSESRLWARQRDYFQNAGIDAWRRGEVPHYITSTAGMASLYAETIVRYWESAREAGELDIEKPLYVLELGAGCGRLTYLLLKALRERLARAQPLRLCYLASDIVEANLGFIAAHPYLAPQVEAGCLDTVPWDAEQGGVLHLRNQGLSIVGTDNPLVVVANYVFDGLRQDLFGFHYGRTLEGRVAALGEELRYEWRAVERADWLAPSWQRRIARYAERLDSASLLFPSGALRCLDHLAKLTRGRYLLLSADKGVFSEQQLRTDSCSGIAFHGSFSLPVNYHALSESLAEQGAKVLNSRHRTDGLVYHVALRSERPELHEACFAGIAERLEALNPDDHFTLKKAVEAVAGQLSPEQLLSMLRLGCYDYRILGLMIDAVSAQIGGLGGESRRLWRDALERCWANFFPLGEDDGFPYRFGLLAGRLSHWGLAREAFRVALAFEGENAACLHQLALCEAASGGAREALRLLERALELQPEDPHARGLCERLRGRLAAQGRTGWDWGNGQGEGQGEHEPLTLEPLEIEHAASLLEQYRDRQIGVMTRLPELDTLEQAVEWIVEQRSAPGRVTCAVVHRCWGFIGVVSLRHHRGAGYFYFWTGIDHQGAGHGRRAAALLFALARENGICELFTSAYPDNMRSRRALAALGFRELAALAEAPDEELLFFHHPLRESADASAGEPVERLRMLCEGIDSPIRVAGMQCARISGTSDREGRAT